MNICENMDMYIYACDECGSRGANIHKYTSQCVNLYKCI